MTIILLLIGKKILPNRQSSFICLKILTFYFQDRLWKTKSHKRTGKAAFEHRFHSPHPNGNLGIGCCDLGKYWETTRQTMRV